MGPRARHLPSKRASTRHRREVARLNGELEAALAAQSALRDEAARERRQLAAEMDAARGRAQRAQDAEACVQVQDVLGSA